MKLYIEYTSHSVVAHVSCSRQPAELLERVEPSRFSCLVCPDRLAVSQDGQECTMEFDIEGYRRLIPQDDDLPPAGECVYLSEKELQHFILSTMEMIHHKYSSPSRNSAGQLFAPNYLGLVNADLAYFGKDRSIRIVCPLFFCSNEVCAEANDPCLGGERMPPGLSAVEAELFALGKLISGYMMALPCVGTPLLICDSVLYTARHRGYSQELGQLLSHLLSLQCDQERFWPKLLSSSYADFSFLSPLIFSSSNSHDAADSSVSEDIELEDTESLDTKLNSFLLAAQSLCNNTFRASSCNAEELLPFLADKANVAEMIDYIYASSETADGSGDDIFSTGDPGLVLNHDDCLNIFVVLLRYSFEAFTLQDIILQDLELARKLLSLPASPSRGYLGTFKRITTSLMLTQQSTSLLLSAYAQQIDLFEQLVLHIHYEEAAGTLLNLIDVCSQFDDEELNSVIVHCVSQVNLCDRLIAAIGDRGCLSVLLSAMYLYERIFNSRVPGLLALAVSGLPSLLTTLNLHAHELHAAAEVTADMSLFVCTCFSACGKVLSIGLSFIFKTVLRISTEPLSSALNDPRLWQEIEIAYPRIVYRLCVLTENLVRFVDAMVSPYPSIAEYPQTPRFATYLYHYLMVFARIFSVTADIRTYLYFKDTGAKPLNEFNGKTLQRDSLHRATEPLLEAPMPYSAQAGSGGPSEIAASATYCLENGDPLPVSLHSLALELLNAGLVRGMCKLFYSYPDAAALHFAVGRVLIPYIELFISDPKVLDTVCLQSSFADVGQEFVKLAACEKGSRSNGFTHYVNLFRSIVRLAAGVSDKVLFTVDWRKLRSKRFEHISNVIPFSVKKLAVIATEPSPATEYLSQTKAIADLSAHLLDHCYELLLSKVSSLAADSNTDSLNAPNVSSTPSSEDSQDSSQACGNECVPVEKYLIGRCDMNSLGDK